jgi:hypothetical protein
MIGGPVRRVRLDAAPRCSLELHHVARRIRLAVLPETAILQQRARLELRLEVVISISALRFAIDLAQMDLAATDPAKVKKGIVRIAFENQPLGTVKATSLTSADVERLRAEVRDVHRRIDGERIR